jgi:hypothetical protein
VAGDGSSSGGGYLGPVSCSSPWEAATASPVTTATGGDAASPSTTRCWSFIHWPEEQVGGSGGTWSRRTGRRERERERRHAARIGAAARALFLRRMGGVAENGEAVCILRWRRFFHLQCYF